MLEKTLESPLDCKEIQPVHPKGDQSWVFIGRTDAKAETPILWPLHKSWFIGKDPDAGRDWGQEEKGMTEDEMAGWYHRLDAHEFGWTLGVSDGHGGLVSCDSWGHKESAMTEWQNWTELNWTDRRDACVGRPGITSVRRKSINWVLSSKWSALHCSAMFRWSLSEPGTWLRIDFFPQNDKL